MSVKQMFVFEEMTAVPHFLTKPQPAALCAWREVTARFYTKVFTKGRPSTGRAVPMKAEKCPSASDERKGVTGREGLDGQSMYRGPCRTLTRHCASLVVFS